MADENSEIDKIIKVVIDEYKNEFQDDDTVMFNKILEKLGITDENYDSVKYEDITPNEKEKIKKVLTDYGYSETDADADAATNYINLILNFKQEAERQEAKAVAIAATEAKHISNPSELGGKVIDGYIEGARGKLINLWTDEEVEDFITDDAGEYKLTTPIDDLPVVFKIEFKKGTGTDIITGKSINFTINVVTTKDSVKKLRSEELIVTPITTLVAKNIEPEIENMKKEKTSEEKVELTDVEPTQEKLDLIETKITSEITSISNALDIYVSDIKKDFIAEKNFDIAKKVVQLITITESYSSADVDQDEVMKSVANALKNEEIPYLFTDDVTKIEENVKKIEENVRIIEKKLKISVTEEERNKVVSTMKYIKKLRFKGDFNQEFVNLQNLQIKEEAAKAVAIAATEVARVTEEREAARVTEEREAEREAEEAAEREAEEAAEREETTAEEKTAARKKEAERKEAKAVAIAATETERKEERQETERKEAARQEAEQKVTARQEAARQEAARQEAARQETTAEEAAKAVAIAATETERQETERQEARQEAERQEAEAERQETERQEAARKEAERKKETERKEAARQEARKEAARKEAERKAEERKKAERVAAEAARKEAERKEAERQETARQEAERQEAAKAVAIAATEAEAEKKRILLGGKLDTIIRECKNNPNIKTAVLKIFNHNGLIDNTNNIDKIRKILYQSNKINELEQIIQNIMEDILTVPKVFIITNCPKETCIPRIDIKYDKEKSYWSDGYCLKYKNTEDTDGQFSDGQFSDGQFSEIFDEPFTKLDKIGDSNKVYFEKQQDKWKNNINEYANKIKAGKDVVVFGFGASGSGKTYGLIEKPNENNVAKLIKNVMDPNNKNNWGIIEDKYYVMDDKSRKDIRLGDIIPVAKCFDKIDKPFIKNITAAKNILKVELNRNAATWPPETTSVFAYKFIYPEYNFRSKAGENKPINELQINEINVTEMHKKLETCKNGAGAQPDDRDPEPLLGNGWKGEKATPELGYYLNLVRWSPNNVASSRGPRVIKYGYKDNPDNHGKLIIVDMPGSESVTDIIKKTYDKLNILKDGPSEDGEGKFVKDEKGNNVKVWSYAGLKSKGLHTILKLPYIDARADKEKADYFFNYKDADQNAIENSINKLRESLLEGTQPVMDEEIINKIIKYAIKGVENGSRLEPLEKIINDLFGNNIKFMGDAAASRQQKKEHTKKKFHDHYELKVFTLSFLYLIRTSYYVQIILFHLKNLFLSKARKQTITDLDWMEDGKLKNMVTEKTEEENKYIGESGGFKGVEMVIPERIPERKSDLKDGYVIRKNGLKLLFDNIIQEGKSKDDPIMVVMGLLNSESELDKYSETIKYLNQINSIDKKCNKDDIKTSFSEISFNKKRNIKISTSTEDDGTLENKYEAMYVGVERPDAVPLPPPPPAEEPPKEKPESGPKAPRELASKAKAEAELKPWIAPRAAKVRAAAPREPASKPKLKAKAEAELKPWIAPRAAKVRATLTRKDSFMLKPKSPEQAPLSPAASTPGYQDFKSEPPAHGRTPTNFPVVEGVSPRAAQVLQQGVDLLERGTRTDIDRDGKIARRARSARRMKWAPPQAAPPGRQRTPAQRLRERVSSKVGYHSGRGEMRPGPSDIGGGTLKRRKPKKKISRKKYYKVARNASRKLNKKNKNTRKIYT